MRKTKQSSWLVVWIGVAMGMLVLASACTTPQEEDTVVQGADQLKQALPSAAEMSIRVPDSSALVA
ncbi:MAG: hypothetical protein FJ125_15870, partial [Deltaproteobacteria bacterium]|nr:hypothetical protein [Deltaproteobacteria bacterium]